MEGKIFIFLFIKLKIYFITLFNVLKNLTINYYIIFSFFIIIKLKFVILIFLFIIFDIK